MGGVYYRPATARYSWSGFIRVSNKLINPQKMVELDHGVFSCENIRETFMFMTTYYNQLINEQRCNLLNLF